MIAHSKTKVGIYAFTSPSGKVYVGQSVDLRRRFVTYRSINPAKEQRHLYNSFISHGFSNHKFEILEECEKSLLNEREIFWENHFISKGIELLNIKPCGGNKVKFSDNTRYKMSLSQTGRKAKASTRIKLSTSKQGEANSQAKLTKDNVFDILKLLAFGKSSAEIGRSMSVKYDTVHDIKRGRTWSSFTGIKLGVAC